MRRKKFEEIGNSIEKNVNQRQTHILGVIAHQDQSAFIDHEKREKENMSITDLVSRFHYREDEP